MQVLERRLPRWMCHDRWQHGNPLPMDSHAQWGVHGLYEVRRLWQMVRPALRLT